jgi:hypothetical protein
MSTLIDRIYEAVQTHRQVVGTEPTIVLLGTKERIELHGFDTVAGLKIVNVALKTFMQVTVVPE